MNVPALIRRLENFPSVLAAILQGVSTEEARAKPPSGAWSILEILAHLADEEVADYRTRLGLTLTNPKAEWPLIDPEGWARDRKYNEMTLSDVVNRYTASRADSVRWLRSLAAADWTLAHSHARFGSIKAGDLLAAWVAHDALHLRQIAKRLYERAAVDAPGFSTRYAGDWGP